MVTTHNLGFPRIGANRELKFALESYWKGATAQTDLEQVAADLRRRHWQYQAALSLAPVGDFSLYDQVLDMGITLGHLPERVRKLQGGELDTYFRLARGRAPVDAKENVVAAGEMTKWFDTNYHYIVPEFSAGLEFALNPARLLGQIAEAARSGVRAKPVIIGPLTYLWLGKSKDGSDRLALLERLLPVYRQLLQTLAQQGVEWVQIDEPILVTELGDDWWQGFAKAYQYLQTDGLKLLLATYFGRLGDNLALACALPVQGLHLDAVNAREEVSKAVALLAPDSILSLGVINGRNIWKTDLNTVLDWLEPVSRTLRDRLWLAPSCSLLHAPVDLDSETALDPEIRSWLAFARQKLDELSVLAGALDNGRDSVAEALLANQEAIESRRRSTRVHNPVVKQAVRGITPAMAQRQSPYPVRAEKQRKKWRLPPFPTTTIGSFPQTAEIRQARQKLRVGELKEADYHQRMEQEISHCVREQEKLGLDVLVHGEAERNDMVEYFGEMLDGYVFTRFGWVQSYGSRCVKPPVIYGDVSRPAPMTVAWSRYAQSLTDKPMKGMLTGPVTILNWSFVRDDQPRSETCLQLALAIRAEVHDLEAAGIGMIQIDEPALREGLPLRRSQWREYLDWAVQAFRIATSDVADETQIHTHMCYSEFNDIMQAIIDLDADVITIETSRSDMELLDAFDDVHYPNEIGPGVYDIHSPNIPLKEDMVALMEKAAEKIPAARLWINPDCGLKTRTWAEVLPALENMVATAQTLRRELSVTRA